MRPFLCDYPMMQSAVTQKNRSVFQNCPSNGDWLFFATHNGIVAIRDTHDRVMNLGLFGRVDHLFPTVVDKKGPGLDGQCQGRKSNPQFGGAAFHFQIDGDGGGGLQKLVNVFVGMCLVGQPGNVNNCGRKIGIEAGES